MTEQMGREGWVELIARKTAQGNCVSVMKSGCISDLMSGKGRQERESMCGSQRERFAHAILLAFKMEEWGHKPRSAGRT